ncbi:MAG: hypothetical protein ABI112_17955 [Terracoccus sp.]
MTPTVVWSGFAAELRRVADTLDPPDPPINIADPTHLDWLEALNGVVTDDAVDLHPKWIAQYIDGLQKQLADNNLTVADLDGFGFGVVVVDCEDDKWSKCTDGKWKWKGEIPGAVLINTAEVLVRSWCPIRLAK